MTNQCVTVLQFYFEDCAFFCFLHISVPMNCTFCADFLRLFSNDSDINSCGPRRCNNELMT